MKIQLIKDNQVLLEGNEGHIHEKVSELLEEKLGFYPSLEARYDEDEEGFLIYLHSENELDLDEEHFNQLIQLNMTQDEEETTTSIKNFLNIDFQVC